jgi:hypothetical protein
MNVDINKMDKLRILKKTELQELLIYYKLKKSGNKPQLFERLLDYYNEHPNVPIYKPSCKTSSGKLIIPSNKTTNISLLTCKNKLIPCNQNNDSKYMTQQDCNNIIYIIDNLTFNSNMLPLFNINIRNQIQNTYNHYKLSYNSKVKVVKVRTSSGQDIIDYEIRRYLYELRHFFELLKIAQKHNDKIITIQRAYKLYLLRKINKLHGPAFIKRTLCKNSDDFVTYESILNIHPNKFYSFRDENDLHIYGFNIESLIEYIRCYKCKKIVNPYNNMPISFNIMQNIITAFNQLRKYKFIIKRKRVNNLSPIHKMKDKAIHVFHRIDMLGNYTDVNWFLDLNIYQLKKLYREAEDIWNYRAQHLTPQIKRKHIPRNDAFRLKPYKINGMTDKLQIQNIILDEFTKFITEGETEEECKTGALWMLTALVKVSPAQSEVMGWLVQ